LQEFADALSGRVADSIDLGCFKPLAPIIAPSNVRPHNTNAPDASPPCYLPLQGKHMPLTIGIVALQEGATTVACQTFIE